MGTRASEHEPGGDALAAETRNDAVHNHDRPTREARTRNPLKIALAITTIFLVVEVVGGIITNSLALLADAGHMATDVAALGLALFATWLARRPATPERSFGFLRAEILAAAVNAATLLAVSIYIFYEAARRFGDPPEVESGLMLAFSVGGLLANGASAFVLSRGGGHSHDLNTRGAFLHVIGDLLGSVAAIAAGVIMWTTGWYLADPILSVVIGGLIVFNAWKLLRESVDVLLEATPRGIDPAAVREALVAVPGVAGVHDLHIWTVTSDLLAASAHLEVTGERAWDEVLHAVTTVLRRDFGIAHTTMQPEAHQGQENAYRGCTFETPEGVQVCLTEAGLQ